MGDVSESAERPGRYQRSTSGLIGALVILLVVIGAFVILRSVFRDELEVEPEAVDYLEVVRQVQQSGGEAFYPATLPEGWRATSATYDPSTGAFGLGLNTDDERFVGLRQADTDLRSLLATYVDSQVDGGSEVTLESAVGDTWQTWSDDGGDHALTIEVGGEQVMVYGSASEEDLRAFAQSLTDDPVTSQE